MAKLNTTVTLVNEDGAEHKFGPADELPGWAEAQLAKSWPADREDLWAEAPKAKAAAKSEGDSKAAPSK